MVCECAEELESEERVSIFFSRMLLSHLGCEWEEVAGRLHLGERGLLTLLVRLSGHDDAEAPVSVREDDEHAVLHRSEGLARLKKRARLLPLQLAIQQHKLLRIPNVGSSVATHTHTHIKIRGEFRNEAHSVFPLLFGLFFRVRPGLLNSLGESE